MESERLPIIESQLRDGQITVSEFVRKLAQSDRYRSLFFDKYPTDYLIAKPAPNRRPGASLNKFREMTRTMKVKV